MHNAAKWKTIVERMVWRMEGKGNIGKAHAGYDAGRKRYRSADEQITLTRYLQQYAQKEIESQIP